MTSDTLDDSWWQQAGDRPRRVWEDAGGAVAHHDQRACALPRQVGHGQQYDHHDEDDENGHLEEGLCHLMYHMLEYFKWLCLIDNNLTPPHPDTNMTVIISHLYIIAVIAKK